VSKPIKLPEGKGNGALIWSTVILWTNDQHFILLRSNGVYEKRRRLSTCGFIFCAHACAHVFTAQC